MDNEFDNIKHYFNYVVMKMTEPEGICPDCGGEIKIRNPTGECDHLYYPEYKKKKTEPKNILMARRCLMVVGGCNGLNMKCINESCPLNKIYDGDI